MLRFTIITCTYNAEDVLQGTLNSVLEQTYPSVQHIIQDGASKDQTITIAQDYREKSTRQAPEHSVLVVSEKDSGLYHAMNNAIERADGDYLVFLNAGDKLPYPTTLADIAAQVEDRETLPTVIYGNTDIVDGEGNFIAHRRLQPPEELSWKSFRHGMLVCHQAFYARTDIAKQTPYNLKYRLSADVDWCIRIMKHGGEMHNTHMLLCNYLDGGMSVKNHRASLKERFHVMTDHYGLFTTLIMHFWFIFRKKS